LGLEHLGMVAGVKDNKMDFVAELNSYAFKADSCDIATSNKATIDNIISIEKGCVIGIAWLYYHKLKGLNSYF